MNCSLNRKGADVGVFDIVGEDSGHKRKDSTVEELERRRKTLAHQEPDRVPMSNFFWGSFIERWRNDLGLADDPNPYCYHDLDWIVTIPSMDPFIRSFEILKENGEEVIFKTGFGATMRKKFGVPGAGICGP